MTAALSVAVADPVRISIDAIGVDAAVAPLHLLSDGSLEAPRNVDDAGWFQGGPEPGEPGASVVAGHVDSKNGPAVFYRLGQLQIGDLVVVHEVTGAKVSFEVQHVEQYAKDAFPTAEVYHRTAGPTLRLITCGGQFNRRTGHYLDNVVVYASLAL